MLRPALAKARAKAREASCKSNLKQMGIGTTLYTDDNDGAFFPMDQSQAILWMERLETEVDTKVYKCATTSENFPDATNRWVFGDANSCWRFEIKYIGSYAFNTNLYSGRNSNKGMPTVTSVKQASSTPMFSDSTWVDVDQDIGATLSDRLDIDRHNNKINIGFADGHVELSSLNGVQDLEWHK